MTDETKKCYKCKGTKPIDAFCRNRSTKDGRADQCRTCASAANRAWQRANPAKVRGYQRKWQEANRAKASAHSCAAQQRRRESDPAFVEEQRQRSLGFHKRRPFWKAARVANRRAEEYGVEGRITEDDLATMLREQDGLCYYCSTPLKEGRERWVEHKQPFSRGGDNTVENVCWACASCNMRKHDLTESEYREVLSGALPRGWQRASDGLLGAGAEDRAYERLLFAIFCPDHDTERSRRYLPFHVARSFVHSRGFARVRDYTIWARSQQRPIDLPADPKRAYGSLWQGWDDWLLASKVDSLVG